MVNLKISELFSWIKQELPENIQARHGHRMLLIPNDQILVLFGSLDNLLITSIQVYDLSEFFFWFLNYVLL
jgi:hypothetical protein